jgi:dienelactone hydrolase
MKALILIAAMLATPAAAFTQASTGDQWLKKPVDQQTFNGFLDFFQYDSNVPFDVKVSDVSEQDGIRREALTFQSTPGTRVTAAYYTTMSPGAQHRPTVVMLHGGVPMGKAGMDPAARALVRAGFNTLAIDMLHFGERKTDLLTTFTEQEKHEKLYNQQAAYLGWVAQNVKDAGRAFDFLVKERGTDARRIALIGFSRGGQQALIVGGADKRFVAIAATYAGHFDRFETGHRAAACPANYIGRIAPRPLYLLNGEFDSDYVKDVSVLPLHKHARKPVTTVWVQTGHQAPTPAALADIIEWLRARVS